MRTLGIDLASQDIRTAVCSIDWSGPRPVVSTPALDRGKGRDDAALVDLIESHDKTGIDAPFGWPADFVEVVGAHHRGRRLPAAVPAHRLAYRVTDAWVQRESALRRWPLSVSTDRIGVVALRCAAILDVLDGVDRSGLTGPVAETYPAAALATWGLNARGYKGDDGPTVVDALYDELVARLPLRVGASDEAVLRRSHDAFDALVCAILARLVVEGQTVPPPEDALDVAAAEGWIHVPASPDTLAARAASTDVAGSASLASERSVGLA